MCHSAELLLVKAPPKLFLILDSSGSLDLSLAVPQPQAKQNKAKTFFSPALSSLFHLLAIFQKEAPIAPTAADSLTLELPGSFY